MAPCLLPASNSAFILISSTHLCRFVTATCTVMTLLRWQICPQTDIRTPYDMCHRELILPWWHTPTHTTASRKRGQPMRLQLEMTATLTLSALVLDETHKGHVARWQKWHNSDGEVERQNNRTATLEWKIKKNTMHITTTISLTVQIVWEQCC